MLRIVLAVVALLVFLLVGRLAFSSLMAKPPHTFGAPDGRLAPCSKRSNCVSSLAGNKGQQIAPLSVSGGVNEATKWVTRAIEAMPRARIITADSGYVHAEFSSRIFRFVDDVELLYDETVPGFQVRSASRSGYSDLGANRRRIETLRTALASVSG